MYILYILHIYYMSPCDSCSVEGGRRGRRAAQAARPVSQSVTASSDQSPVCCPGTSLYWDTDSLSWSSPLIQAQIQALEIRTNLDFLHHSESKF